MIQSDYEDQVRLRMTNLDSERGKATSEDHEKMDSAFIALLTYVKRIQ